MLGLEVKIELDGNILDLLELRASSTLVLNLRKNSLGCILKIDLANKIPKPFFQAIGCSNKEHAINCLEEGGRNSIESRL